VYVCERVSRRRQQAHLFAECVWGFLVRFNVEYNNRRLHMWNGHLDPARAKAFVEKVVQLLEEPPAFPFMPAHSH
jgi:transposase InsO family protein